MKPQDQKKWFEKNERINSTAFLSLGDKVIDVDGNKGIVVKIIEPEDPKNPSIDDHGTIFVWQLDRIEYGSDNCEHYCYTNWKKILRKI